MLNPLLSLGIDSVSAINILRNNLAGYVIKTDTGTFVKYDNKVINLIDSIKRDLDSLRFRKKIN
jgi:hypothetical protein